jgi:MarR family 2-MHQ and catechol resistance regulon transcriptional repressor
MTKTKQEDISLALHSATSSLDAVLVFNLLRTCAHISPYLDRNLRDMRLTGSQFNVLLLLHGQEGALPLGEIGRRLVVTKANVTGLVDRLEEKGFVRRATCDDRRVTMACLTEQGARVVDDFLPAHEKLLGKLVDCLTKTEKRNLSALLTKLRQGLRATCHR